MGKDCLDEEILDVEKNREVAKKNKIQILLLSLLVVSMGGALAYLFRDMHTESQYLTLLGLLSQIIAFAAAIMLSGQFLSIPDKFSGIHNYAIAATLSAPIYIWLGGFLYSTTALFLGSSYSELWTKASTIVCFGLGMVIYAAGSIEEALSLKITDKSAVVGLGWYMVIFSLGIQVYISLIKLGVIS